MSVMKAMYIAGTATGPERYRIKKYEVSVMYAQSRKLRRRLNDPIWEDGRTYHDPKDNTRMHRPGSQKK